MKVIDLLNKIAKGEEAPEKIKYKGTIYKKDNDGDIDYYFAEDFSGNLLLGKLDDTNELREKVEIIEEEKDIEKLDIDNDTQMINGYEMTGEQICELAHKINELIDIVKELRSKE